MFCRCNSLLFNLCVAENVHGLGLSIQVHWLRLMLGL